MSDPRFFDLAMKAIAQQSSEAERAELDAWLAREPELRAEFARLQADTRLAREVLPLANAAKAAETPRETMFTRPGRVLPSVHTTEVTAPQLPAWARGRLQAKVRDTLGRPQSSGPSAGDAERHMMWRWRWLLGLAAAAAVVTLVMVPLLRKAPAPVVQVAMLDTAGPSRGAEAKELALLQQTWNKAVVDSFASTENARAWETNWPGDDKGAVVKVIYDQAAGELRVLGRWKATSFARTFVVEQDFETVLNQAKAFIQEQTNR